MVLKPAVHGTRAFPKCLSLNVWPRASTVQHRRNAAPWLMASSSSRFKSTTTELPPIEKVQKDLREAMRHVAQPVAIITARLPPSGPDEKDAFFHGATISSFTTISMNPPLVAFSLQAPSRIADAIESHPHSASSSTSSQAHAQKKPHFLINLLSYPQADSAAAFAKPGLSPLRFDTRSGHLQTADPAHASPAQRRVDVPAWRSRTTVDNIPGLKGSMSALACRLEFKLDLSQQASLSHLHNTQPETVLAELDDQDVVGQGVASSQLFIATVCAVERDPGLSDSSAEPLVYTRHQFYTISRES